MTRRLLLSLGVIIASGCAGSLPETAPPPEQVQTETPTVSPEENEQIVQKIKTLKDKVTELGALEQEADQPYKDRIIARHPKWDESDKGYAFGALNYKYINSNQLVLDETVESMMGFGSLVVDTRGLEEEDYRDFVKMKYRPHAYEEEISRLESQISSLEYKIGVDLYDGSTTSAYNPASDMSKSPIERQYEANQQYLKTRQQMGYGYGPPPE
jgi:hypothetical protein